MVWRMSWPHAQARAGHVMPGRQGELTGPAKPSQAKPSEAKRSERCSSGRTGQNRTERDGTNLFPLEPCLAPLHGHRAYVAWMQVSSAAEICGRHSHRRDAWLMCWFRSRCRWRRRRRRCRRCRRPCRGRATASGGAKVGRGSVPAQALPGDEDGRRRVVSGKSGRGAAICVSVLLGGSQMRARRFDGHERRAVAGRSTVPDEPEVAAVVLDERSPRPLAVVAVQRA